MKAVFFCQRSGLFISGFSSLPRFSDFYLEVSPSRSTLGAFIHCLSSQLAMRYFSWERFWNGTIGDVEGSRSGLALIIHLDRKFFLIFYKLLMMLPT